MQPDNAPHPLDPARNESGETSIGAAELCQDIDSMRRPDSTEYLRKFVVLCDDACQYDVKSRSMSS